MRCALPTARCVLERWVELPRPPEWLEREDGGGGGEEMRQGETDRDLARVALVASPTPLPWLHCSISTRPPNSRRRPAQTLIFRPSCRMEIFLTLRTTPAGLQKFYQRNITADANLTEANRGRRRSPTRGTRCTGTAANESADPMDQSARQ